MAIFNCFCLDVVSALRRVEAGFEYPTQAAILVLYGSEDLHASS
jgi:hypothetical protein